MKFNPKSKVLNNRYEEQSEDMQVKRYRKELSKHFTVNRVSRL